jgi:hypothetical protein
MGGLYLAACAIRENVAPHAVDPQRAEQLWTISERLCGSTVPQAESVEPPI